MTNRDLVPISALWDTNAASAYYGVDRLLAWARKRPRRFSYPYVLGVQVDGQWYFDQNQALDHVEQLWETVFEYRMSGQRPAWWAELIDHRESHPVYAIMLDHLDDIARRQHAYEQEEG